MAILDIAAEEQIRVWLSRFPTAAPVIVVPIFNAIADARACLECLIRYTRSDTPIMLLDDASTDPAIAQLVDIAKITEHVLYLKQLTNVGFVRNANNAFRLCDSRDVVLVNSDVIVPPGWLERLRDAAYYRSNVATATPLTNHGSLVSVPHRNTPSAFPNPATQDAIRDADDRIRATSRKTRPSLLAAIGHCTYYRRSVLDAVGVYDEAFSPGYEEEVDFCLRAGTMGFVHVVADDLFVYHKGSQSFDPALSFGANQVREQHREVIARRYPYYQLWAANTASDAFSPLSQAINRASSALLGRRVAIDISFVDGSARTGYQVVGAELARAMAHSITPGDALTFIVSNASQKAHWQRELSALATAPSHTVLARSEVKVSDLPTFDVIFRPGQIYGEADLHFLRTAATRCVVHQLDFNMYAMPAFFDSYDAWQRYQRLTEMTLALADGVTFNSEWVATQARHVGIAVPPERSSIIYNGVDHTSAQTQHRPNGLPEERPFILMLGANYTYKNRLFAIRMYAHLVTRQQWDGLLVFAGPHMPKSDSADLEAAELNSLGDIRYGVVDVGDMSESEKQWLLHHAALVLYPSLSEGFGLVPIEAGLANTPALSFHATSLGEVLGSDVRYLQSFDPASASDGVWDMLTNKAIRAQQIWALKEQAQLFTWARCAEVAWRHIDHIAQLPPRAPTAGIAIGKLASPGNASRAAWVKLRKDLRERLRIWSNAYRHYGTRALWHEVRSYTEWRLSQIGLISSKK